MWQPWNAGPVSATLAAMFLALALTAGMGRFARTVQRRLALHGETAALPDARRTNVSLCVLAVVFAGVCVWAFGATPAALAAIVFIVVLLTLARVDAETGLLPDLLTQPLLWLGLLVNLNGTFVMLQHAVLGAVAGYLILWVVFRLFLLFTGREGMGHGDFKLLAAIGAWLGWAALPWVLLASSSLALAAAVLLRLRGRMAPGDALSFGRYLAAAGILALFGVFAMP